MTRTPLAFAVASATFALGACQHLPGNSSGAEQLSEAEEPVSVTVEEPAPLPETAACDVLESRGWEAWVNKMPGPGATPTIHVIGRVDMRTGGYTFDWQEGPLDRSARPALRLKLVPKAPDGMALQAITAEDVKYQAPAFDAGYSRVIISCGDTTLGEITEITDVF